MVKRVTRYLSGSGRPIYSENGQFYYTRNNGETWRRLANASRYYTWSWEPNNGNYNNVNLNHQGTIANLKANFNRASRTLQRVERGRASRKRTAFGRTIFGRLPNNLFSSIFRR